MADACFILWPLLLPEMQEVVRDKLSYCERIWLSRTSRHEHTVAAIRTLPIPICDVMAALNGGFPYVHQRVELTRWADAALLTPLDQLIDLRRGEPFVVSGYVTCGSGSDPGYGYSRIYLYFGQRTPPEVPFQGRLILTIPFTEDGNDIDPMWHAGRYDVAWDQVTDDTPSLGALVPRPIPLAELQAWLREQRARPDLTPYQPDPESDSDD